jgi:hypothetical protein
MTLQNHAKKYALLYSVLLIAALARLLYAFDAHELWWDSGVYVGMAKYLWSGGTAGLWEHIRPVLWPAVLGIAWWLKLNIVLFARILSFALSLASIALVYQLGRQWFSERAGIIASILWGFSSIVFYLGFHEYTELPAVTLALAALLAFTRQHVFFAGILASAAFLFKFPAGIFIVVLGLCLLARKQWKQLIPLGIGFALPTAAYLTFNALTSGSALGPLIAARESILSVLGCNVLRYKPWYQYLGWIAFDNVLNVLALAGVGIAAARRDKRFLLPALALLIPAAYLLQMHCRDYRYLTLFLPFVVLFAGHGIERIVLLVESKKRRAWAYPAALILILAVSLTHALLFFHANEPRVLDLNAERYYRWLADNPLDGEIWSANPAVSAYTDAPVRKIYYPLYEQGQATDFNTYLFANPDRIGAVLLDNCGGGIICPPEDTGCAQQLDATRAFLNEHYKQVFFAQTGNCWYSIYTRRTE